LVDVFEEDPLAEAAALGALTVRFRHDVLPAHFVGRGEGLDLGARQQTFVRLEDLAVPYTAAICEHTLLSQLGPDPASRNQTLVRRHTAAIEMMRSSWTPPASRVGR
jgi:hypothetical protein